MLVFTVFEGVVLSTAWGQFLHLPAAQPRPLMPELRVEIGQGGEVVFDLCKKNHIWLPYCNKALLSLLCLAGVSKCDITKTTSCSGHKRATYQRDV